MSQPTDPKDEALRDRLIEQALGETLGGESPPDLSDKILAAVEKPSPLKSRQKERVMEQSKRRLGKWLAYGTVGCLVVGVCYALLLSGRQASREAAFHAVDARESVVQAERHLASKPEDLLGFTIDGDKFGPPPASLDLEEQTSPTPDYLPDDSMSISPPKFPLKPAAREPAPTRPSIQYLKDLHNVNDRDLRSGVAGMSESDDVLRDTNKWLVYRELSSNYRPEAPYHGGDRYDSLADNSLRAVKDHPLSTFSIDVDTASYANVRRFLLQDGRLPPPGAVRIEELINYFDYDYAGPEDDVPFAAHIEVAGCPWKPDHRLVRVGLKGKEISSEERPASNLVFLLDVSGSMSSSDKLPLLKAGMRLLAEQLRPNDRVAIVVYAGSEGLVLPSTPGSRQKEIIGALAKLESGGSTNGGAGIELAYRVAREHFIEDGVNRVILCTDGDFNVGTTSTAALVRMVEEKAKAGVFLSVLGFGRGNLNDNMMEKVSNKGNGNYAYIDGLTEAHKVLVQQLGGTLVTIAKDVKIQIEFNPARVAAYRLIGYENRILAAEDFNDDKKDAGEIGAGHTVTALYEVVPAGMEVNQPAVDPLKYQKNVKPKREKAPAADNSISDELLTLKLRYKAPDGDTSRKLEFPIVDPGKGFSQASPEMQFASAVASFGMLLRHSEYKGDVSYDAVLEIATASKGPDPHDYRAEFLQMVRRAKALSGR